MKEPNHIDETRQLIIKLDDVMPLFMETFNSTASPGLASLLNELTPTLISCRHLLETFCEMEIARGIRKENIIAQKIEPPL